MKTIICLLLFISFSIGIQAQGFWEWTEPEPLTDSLTNNRNAFLFKTYVKGEYRMCMLFEKEENPQSSEIWWDFFGDGLPPESIMKSFPDVLFKHPKALSYPYAPNADSTFYIFYETNQVGNNDIYYMICRSDGTLTLPQPLANSSEDESQLTVFRPYFFYDNAPVEMGPLVWIRGTQLWGCSLIDDGGQYFTEELLLDSAVCSNPSYGEAGFTGDSPGVLYERQDSSGTFLYKIDYYGDGIWGSPEVYFDSLESKNPTRTSEYGDACWSVLDDTVWKVAKKDQYWYSDTLLIDTLSKNEPFDPAALGQVLGVDEWSGAYWIAVTYPVDSVDEIFMTNMGPYNGFENYTNSGVMNRNPKFFMGESASTDCWYDYLVWESYRNGHWQIWASKTIQCVGSVDENENPEPLLQLHPNPFSHQTTISFALESRSDVRIEAYDLQGRLMGMIAQQSYDQGEHQLRWNAENLPEGVYLIRMTIDGEVYTSKIIKAH